MITLDEAKQLQRDFQKEIKILKDHAVKNENRKEYKDKVLKNIDMLYKKRNKVIRGFRDGDFLIKDFAK